MTDIILAIGVVAFIVHTSFHISYVRSMKRTSERMGDFLQITEKNLNDALAELRDTLENLKKITGNAIAVSEDVRQISGTVASVEKSIHGIYEYVTENLGPATGANIAGLKAGITTGVTTLMKNLKEERRDNHERGT